MLFTDPFFIFYFLPAALVAHRLALKAGPQGRYGNAAKLCLFAFTLLFYGFENPWWLVPFVGAILMDWVWARCLAAETRVRRRRLWLGLSVAQNVGLLFLLKYWTLFAEGPLSFLPQLFLDGNPAPFPAGLSFYTLESLSFVIDVYRRDVVPPKSPLDVLAFLGMFPRLVAGPIARYKQAAEQFRDYRGMHVEAGLYLFLWGLFLKTCFADQCSVFVKYAFDHGGELDFLSAWVGVVAYALQVYFDFSGYSLMAIGLGRAFGFTFPQNFDKPYVAESMQAFWTRWHMTLGQWVRDYVFLPLAVRARKVPGGVGVSLVASMLLVGLWHGPKLTFLVMGAWCGLWMALERATQWPERIGAKWSRPITFVAVLVAWTIFRAPTLGSAATIVGALLNPFTFATRFNDEAIRTNPIAAIFALVALIYCFIIEPSHGGYPGAVRRNWASAGAALTLFAVSLLCAYSAHLIPFLYFQY